MASLSVKLRVGDLTQVERRNRLILKLAYFSGGMHLISPNDKRDIPSLGFASFSFLYHGLALSRAHFFICLLRVLLQMFSCRKMSVIADFKQRFTEQSSLECSDYLAANQA